MLELAAHAAVILIGLSGGVAVGSGLVALLVILDLIPRLAQLAKAYRKSRWFETAIVVGAVYWTFADFFGWTLHLPRHLLLPAVGLLDGVFIGMLAAALTEVVNVLPIMAKRLRLSDYLIALVMAMVLGKVAGSLFDWLVFYR
ncbi:stage V sporulation protein AB [Paenibacillus darwinianus]|uniref:Stage V sporulation protein AB n=1 Tax=Paenibacillus darwinianus TaxID=1380763 RepID=A0A9W5S0I2_9BACL|nr:stage V sporulation protein AB [Paenibacillus darwinianus]EXX88244.1 stage V sporulation protein AB [Paenibacillus darwinianus]EXX88571.1 stage V sporulation protein AB [Paenibacillus darwinianus]EXX91762.1 stage V sporulation protein AB [Paenibacillus darwinianus]